MHQAGAFLGVLGVLFVLAKALAKQSGQVPIWPLARRQDGGSPCGGSRTPRPAMCVPLSRTAATSTVPLTGLMSVHPHPHRQRQTRAAGTSTKHQTEITKLPYGDSR